MIDEIQPTFWSATLICAGVAMAHRLAGPVGVSVLALGALSTSGVRFADFLAVAIDATAWSIAPEKQSEELNASVGTRRITLETRAGATLLGIALTGAILSVISLFGAYGVAAGPSAIEPAHASVFVGLVAGVSLPILWVVVAAGGSGSSGGAKGGEIAYRDPSGGTGGGATTTGEARSTGTPASGLLRGMRFTALLVVGPPLAVGLLSAELLTILLMGSTASALILGFLLVHAAGRGSPQAPRALSAVSSETSVLGIDAAKVAGRGAASLGEIPALVMSISLKLVVLLSLVCIQVLF